MVYGTLSMINFAHGDVFMVGAFLCFPRGYGTRPAVSLPTLLLRMAAQQCWVLRSSGWRTSRCAMRTRVSAIITALGVGLFLENLMLAFYTLSTERSEAARKRHLASGGVSISSLQVVIIGLSRGADAGARPRRASHAVGMAMRAISWDKSYVPLMGISGQPDHLDHVRHRRGTGRGRRHDVRPRLPGHRPVHGNPHRLEGVHRRGGWRHRQRPRAMIGAFHPWRRGNHGGRAAALHLRDLVVFSLLLALIIVRPHGILGQPRVQKV
jgi:branched-chain amino acid transport system permease protein